HVSAMANRFVKDPREVVKSGDVVRVKVLAVDVPRNRIGLSLRLDDSAEAKPSAGSSPGKVTKRPPARGKPAAGALADALRRAGYDKRS
ncbi:MAG: S1 RNA-binding domain-containing protein, partial [Actinomycetota bacterium]|nr:S1 RNA-binding domain-containing protein [Actinomycetota bacterium]